VPATVTASSSAIFAANRVASRIALAIGADGGRSRAARVYEDGALRVRFPNDDHLQAIVVNTAGGITGGDRIAFDIAVEPGAAFTLTTAAAEKTYRSLGDDATVDVTLRVAAGGTLHWLPQETILFNGARLSRSIEADLAGDARLLLAEAVIFGRTAMRETVEQGRLLDRWRVRRDGRLVFADTLKLDGAVAAQLARRAVAAGGCAVATVLVAPACEEEVAAVRAQSFLGEVGVSSWNGITLARLVARDGAALRHDLKLIVTRLAGALPRIWSN
jgi:urease accessory protein